MCVCECYELTVDEVFPCVPPSLDDLEKAEEKYEEAKRELDETIKELEGI